MTTKKIRTDVNITHPGNEVYELSCETHDHIDKISQLLRTPPIRIVERVEELILLRDSLEENLKTK